LWGVMKGKEKGSKKEEGRELERGGGRKKEKAEFFSSARRNEIILMPSRSQVGDGLPFRRKQLRRSKGENF